MDIRASIQIDPTSLKVMSQADIDRQAQADKPNP